MNALLEFFTKFYKEIAFLLYVAILSIVHLSGDPRAAKNLDNYQLFISSNLPLLVLFWMYFLEKGIDKKLNNLKKEVDQNEDLLRELFNGFSHCVTDSTFDRDLRAVVSKYPTIEIEDFAIREMTIKLISKAKNALNEREFPIDFGQIAAYPKPFYDSCDGEILATNIGKIDQGFHKGINSSELINLTREAIEIHSKNNKDFRIRKIFVLEKNDLDEKLHEAMESYYSMKNIEIKYISREDARFYAARVDNNKIQSLKDFTVFISKDHNIDFSGRLMDIDIPTKMLISTNREVNKGLKKQFDTLWFKANKYEGESRVSDLNNTDTWIKSLYTPNV